MPRSLAAFSSSPPGLHNYLRVDWLSYRPSSRSQLRHHSACYLLHILGISLLRLAATTRSTKLILCLVGRLREQFQSAMSSWLRQLRGFWKSFAAGHQRRQWRIWPGVSQPSTIGRRPTLPWPVQNYTFRWFHSDLIFSLICSTEQVRILNISVYMIQCLIVGHLLTAGCVNVGYCSVLRSSYTRRVVLHSVQRNDKIVLIIFFVLYTMIILVVIQLLNNTRFPFKRESNQNYKIIVKYNKLNYGRCRCWITTR